MRAHSSRRLRLNTFILGDSLQDRAHTSDHSDIPLIFQKKIEIENKPNRVIRFIDALGYRDGDFLIFINPVNNITSKILNNALKSTSLPLSIEIQSTGQVKIKINNKTDLNNFFTLLSSIEPLATKQQFQIDEAFSKHFPATYNGYKSHGINFLMQPKIGRKIDTAKEPSVNDEKLFNAVNSGDPSKVKALLISGISPNTALKYGKTPLIYATWEYIHKQNQNWYDIIKLLLDYGADYTIEHGHLHETALSTVAEWGHTELVDLMLKYRKTPEFKLCDTKEAEHPETVAKLKEHYEHERMTLFSKTDNVKTEVAMTQPENKDAPLITHFKSGSQTLHIKTLLTTKLSDEYIEKLFKLYQPNFSSKSEPTVELQKKHFYEKLGLHDKNKQVYIDIIEAEGKIIGFNLYEVYQDEYEKKPYMLVYGSLAYIDIAYRGSRIMTLLGYRGPFAVKQANPQQEVYVFFDSIHPNSFGPIWGLKAYPMYRSAESLAFVKHATSRIYGKERVARYDGVNHFFWPTDSRVNGSSKTTGLPCVSEKFNELTEGKGGVPVMFPIDDEHFYALVKATETALNSPNTFEAHTVEYARYKFDSVEKTKCPWNNSSTLLWPKDPQNQPKESMPGLKND